MTTVISRLYPNEKAAQAVVSALHDVGFPADTTDIVTANHGGNLADAIKATRVASDAASIYAQELKNDTALMVVRAPFTPFGAAREAMNVVDGFDALSSAVTDNNVLVRDEPARELFLSILPNHPLFMTDRREMGRNDGRISHGFGWRLLSPRRTKASAMSGGRFMSRLFWPMPLLSQKKNKSSVYKGGKKFLTS